MKCLEDLNSCRYFQDLAHSAAVVKAILSITQSASRAAATVSKAVEEWRIHAHVWKADQEAVLAALKVSLTRFVLKQMSNGHC